MSSAEAATARLEAVFAHIRDTRMQGVPILNEAMPVKAVGLREWGAYWLGVMVTPWFMNLVLLPREGAGADVAWPGMRVTEGQTHAMPSGQYAFLLSEEDGLGRYQMCSLFSPMAEFADAEAAIATAEAVMVALFEAPCPDDAEPEQAEASPPVERPAPKPMSRRALLFGRSDTGKDAP